MKVHETGVEMFTMERQS